MSTMMAPTFPGFSPAIDPLDQAANIWLKIHGASAPRAAVPAVMTPDPILRIATAVRNALTPAKSYVPSVSGWHVSPEMIQSLASMGMASDKFAMDQRAQAAAEERAQAQDDLARQRMALEIQNEGNRPTPEEQFKMQIASHVLANQYDTQKAMDLRTAQAALQSAHDQRSFENQKVLRQMTQEGSERVAEIYRRRGDEDKPKFMNIDGSIVALDPRAMTAKTVPVQDTRGWMDRFADWMSRKAIPMGNLYARLQGLQQGEERSDINAQLRAIGMLMNPNSTNLPVYTQPSLRKLAGGDKSGGAPADPYKVGGLYKDKDGRIAKYLGDGQWAEP